MCVCVCSEKLDKGRDGRHVWTSWGKIRQEEEEEERFNMEGGLPGHRENQFNATHTVPLPLLHPRLCSFNLLFLCLRSTCYLYIQSTVTDILLLKEWVMWITFMTDNATSWDVAALKISIVECSFKWTDRSRLYKVSGPISGHTVGLMTPRGFYCFTKHSMTMAATNACLTNWLIFRFFFLNQSFCL